VIKFRPRSDESVDHPDDLVVEWFNTYRSGLLRYAQRMLPASESAEDVVQDIFCRILRYPDPTALRNPQAFLMTMARNTVIDRLRRIKAAPAFDENNEEISALYQKMHHPEMMVAMEQAIQELPENCRRVLILKRFHGLDTPAVARSMGVSARMVQKHLATAMAHLYDRLT
jgi:RNA polymerase sigma-70 factor (ECF subfamily)